MATITNIVKFAAKFLNMAKNKGKDKKKAAAKAKPAKTKSKPVAKKTAKPVKKAKPASKKAKPAASKKAVAKTINKKVVAKAKPAAKKVVKEAKPALVKTAKPVAKPEVKRIIKSDVNLTSKQLYKPQPKPQPAAEKPNKKKKTMDDLNLRYSDKELKEFKDLIDNKLTAAREELKNLKEALDNHTESQAGNKAWNMEEGTDTTEMEYLMNQISRQHTYIRNLELALVRIENKTYGICRVTGKLIPKERLRVVPHATLSLEAKNNRKADEETPAATSAAPPTDFAEGFED